MDINDPVVLAQVLVEQEAERVRSAATAERSGYDH